MKYQALLYNVFKAIDFIPFLRWIKYKVVTIEYIVNGARLTSSSCLDE